MRAFLAPLSWATLTTQSENNMNSDDYDTLILAAKPVVQDMPFIGMNLPTKAEVQKMKKMWVCFHAITSSTVSQLLFFTVKLVVGSRMKLMKLVFNPMSEDQRTQVIKWAKEQITQNYFNCTMRPSSDSRLSKTLVKPIKSETTF